MKVHHLNCGSMTPPASPPLVCHVLLVETDAGLVLVDSGFGLDDIAEPSRRIGPTRYLLKAALDAGETAARQVERLGFAREDVRHIVLTHFDVDHIGGLSDFPHAQVHVTAAEAAGAMHSPSWREKLRYRSSQWAHGPNIVEHDPDGERWRGFAAARELTGIAPGIVLVSLPGHTRGHACVAVDAGSGAGDRWVLHAGDAFYHRATLDGGSSPFLLRAMETLIAYDLPQVRDNHARLAELHHRGEPDLMIVSAHDGSLLESARANA
jgi:glyoxylase-like metal-dependent hydrolase (beta-lactamase superfamily II)